MLGGRDTGCDAMTRLFIAVLVIAPAIAAAAPPRSFAVEVTPATDWRAEALATALRADLVDDRLVTAAPGGAPELVVHVELEPGVARYELEATWPVAPPPRAGTIVLGGVDRAGVAARLRDELHRLARATRDDRARTTITPPSVFVVGLALVVLAALLVIPFAIGRRLVRTARAAPAAGANDADAGTNAAGANVDADAGTNAAGANVDAAAGADAPAALAKLPGAAAIRPVLVALAGVGGLAIVIAATGAHAAWLGLGGLAWGTLVAVTAPVVFPPVVGLGRIEQGELARVLAAWLAAVARRAAAVAVLYAPLAIVTWLVTDAVVVPLALLAIRLWVRCAIAVGADVLDARLVDTSADLAAWEGAARAYVAGYVRRSRLAIDPVLRSRVRLLPGRTDEVCIYGGGLTASRIVIPRRMLELALAPAGRPHDYAAPRVSTLHWTEWNAGLIMPTELDAKVATAEQRQPHAIAVEADVDHEREAEREVIGEPPTLAGTIEPSDLDPHPRAYRPHDDPMWLDWDSGEEHDGTDPGDRDFLFGAIVYGLGEIQRHADRPATLALLLPRLPRRGFALADLHAGLAGARHHLVQYLSWRLWRREDLLTARAFAPELEAATRRVLAQLAPGPDARREPRRPGCQACRSRCEARALARAPDSGSPIRRGRHAGNGSHSRARWSRGSASPAPQSRARSAITRRTAMEPHRPSAVLPAGRRSRPSRK